jgi:palmitoyltransferase
MGFFYQVFTTSLGLFLLINTFVNYGKAMFMDAGTPPFFNDAKESELVDAAGEELGQAAPPKACKKCGRWKPPRAHHCSVCNRCVLKMDHHCPWINNCVGFNNYRFFLLFLLYLSSSCIFVLVVFIFAVLHHAKRRPSSKGIGSLEDIFMQVVAVGDSDEDGQEYIMMSFLLAASILVALCFLGGMHVYLLLTNQTTIEFQMNLSKRREARSTGVYWRNPYDMGRRRNFQQVFGPNDFCRFSWLLPCIAKTPEGDGMVFPSLWRIKA